MSEQKRTGREITMKEARELALNALHRAEEERGLAAERDALINSTDAEVHALESTISELREEVAGLRLEVQRLTNLALENGADYARELASIKAERDALRKTLKHSAWMNEWAFNEHRGGGEIRPLKDDAYCRCDWCKTYRDNRNDYSAQLTNQKEGDSDC